MTPLAVKLVQRCGTAQSLQAESALQMGPYFPITAVKTNSTRPEKRTFDLKIPDFHGSLAVPRIAYGSYHSRQNEQHPTRCGVRLSSQPSKRSRLGLDLRRVFGKHSFQERLGEAFHLIPVGVNVIT